MWTEHQTVHEGPRVFQRDLEVPRPTRQKPNAATLPSILLHSNNTLPSVILLRHLANSGSDPPPHRPGKKRTEPTRWWTRTRSP